VQVYDWDTNRVDAWHFDDGAGGFFLRFAWEMSPKQRFQAGIGKRPKRPRFSWRRIKSATEPDEAKVTRGARFVETDAEHPTWETYETEPESDEIVDDIDPLTRAFKSTV
jgi:hypothetical protein